MVELRPDWNDPDQDFDTHFVRAMELMLKEFTAKVRFYGKVWWPARSLVLDAYDRRLEVHSSGKIIDVGKFCPWREHLLDMEREKKLREKVLFVIYREPPAEVWKVMAVREPGRQFQSRLDLPREWRGLEDEALVAVSGIPGCIFVHGDGFIGGNRTRDGVVRMAAAAMERAGGGRSSYWR